MRPRPAEAAPTPADATVVVCAYTLDRWDDLVSGVRGSVDQGVGRVVVVIDHNDDLLTRAREALAGRSEGGTLVEVVPNLRVQGASGARNTAIDMVEGGVVVFLDDDATPQPGWIEALLEPYADPAVAAVGGAADPRWPVARPPQLVGELNWIVGCTYTGQPETRTDVRNLWGCNMSVRASVLDEVGGFDEQVGRIGLIPLGGEETELCIRIHQRVAGARVVYEPRARVDHRVTPARTTWAYLRSRSMAEGLSKAAMAAQVGADDATSVERDYVRRVLTAAVRREVAAGLRGDRNGWRGAAGVVTALAVTGAGYVRGRVGLSGSADREAAARRAPSGRA